MKKTNEHPHRRVKTAGDSMIEVRQSKSDAERANLLVRIPKPLYQELKTVSFNSDQSMNLLVEKALHSYLDDFKKKKKSKT